MSGNELKWSFFIFIGGTLFSLIMSGAWLLNGEWNVFQAISSFNTINIDAAGGWGAAKGVIDFFDGIITMFTWNYPYLNSPWAFPIKAVGWIVSAGVAWGLVQAFSGMAQGIIGSIRSMIS